MNKDVPSNLLWCGRAVIAAIHAGEMTAVDITTFRQIPVGVMKTLLSKYAITTDTVKANARAAFEKFCAF